MQQTWYQHRVRDTILTPFWSPLEPIGAHLGHHFGQKNNKTAIVFRSTFRSSILSVLASFWRGFGRTFGSQKAIEARKGQKWKIELSCTRELNFQGLLETKINKPRSRKRSEFRNAFLLNFTPFWIPF